MTHANTTFKRLYKFIITQLLWQKSWDILAKSVMLILFKLANNYRILCQKSRDAQLTVVQRFLILNYEILGTGVALKQLSTLVFALFRLAINSSVRSDFNCLSKLRLFKDTLQQLFLTFPQNCMSQSKNKKVMFFYCAAIIFGDI